MSIISLSVTCLVTILFIVYLTRFKNRTQLQNIFIISNGLLTFWCITLLLQIFFTTNYNVDPMFFDNFVYIAACFIPVSIYFTGLIYENTKIYFKKRYLLLTLIPLISLLVLWTNNYHHLFYKVYSVNIEECVYGPYITVHHIYSYLLLFLGVFHLLRFSIKNSGFFSKQSILIVLGISIPLVINLFGTFQIIPMSIYITPISFTFSVICFTFAMFKFDFLNVAPIALQRIVDRISDSYIVLNEENKITDFNETFLTTFGLKSTDIRNKDFISLFKTFNERSVSTKKLISILNKVKTSNRTYNYEKHFKSVNKYFNIEINNIQANNTYIGTLILLKDITQHMQDMNTIKDNQVLLIERERLASLGQLVGGIAHNLKTPIMSIAGAAEGLIDLVNEYATSIGDSEVTVEDHHEIARDMNEWIEKIKTHTEYMSDVITAVKGQTVALSDNVQDTFTVQELIKRVNILMKHELKNALIDLNVILNTDDMIVLHGNVNSLVQVINNMISNSIQAYNGETNKCIDLIIEKEDNNIIISVQDYASGMTPEVKEKLFKEMVTTKGKNGTGLGMFMSYSTIRGHFNGNITFASEVGIGTRFNVILPL